MHKQCTLGNPFETWFTGVSELVGARLPVCALFENLLSSEHEIVSYTIHTNQFGTAPSCLHFTWYGIWFGLTKGAGPAGDKIVYNKYCICWTDYHTQSRHASPHWRGIQKNPNEKQSQCNSKMRMLKYILKHESARTPFVSVWCTIKNEVCNICTGQLSTTCLCKSILVFVMSKPHPHWWAYPNNCTYTIQSALRICFRNPFFLKRN